jgi:hypothetical protein
VDVIVEKIESVPDAPGVAPGGAEPPAPTVIGKDVPPVNVNFVPPGNEVL